MEILRLLKILLIAGAATGSFSSPIGSMYVQKHFKEEAKKSMDEMVRDIRKEFDNILNEVDWMDDKTKKRAKVKQYYTKLIISIIRNCVKIK